VAGVADDNVQAVDMARHSIDSGAAKDKIDTVARITSETS
jgi:anthranilate phosphoribosyltransferase